MNAALLGGSLIAVLALAGIARLLGLGRVEPLDADAACAIARDRVIGFAPWHAVIATDGNAALVLGDKAAVAIRRHGTGVLVAPLALPLAITGDGDGARLTTGDPRIGVLFLPPDPELLTRL